jgi:NAD(P)H dehydrogenase (quinone)
MYAVTGITGKVGGTVAHDLLAAGQKVRAVVRDAAKGKSWAAKGCEVAIAELGDAAAPSERVPVGLLMSPGKDSTPAVDEAQSGFAAAAFDGFHDEGDAFLDGEAGG